MSGCAPIILFVYNRPEHTRRTVEALAQNELAGSSDLIVYCDGARPGSSQRAVEEVRSLVRGIQGFRSLKVVCRDSNLGLAASIVSGVTEVVNEWGSAIILEDDLVTSPFFLRYMNDGLCRYAGDERVVSLHGYAYPLKRQMPETYFLYGADCWGWATWSRAWAGFEADGRKLLEQLQASGLLCRFDFNGSFDYSGMLEAQIRGDNDSWAIRWYASALLNRGLTLYPGRSLVRNIGNDQSGEHSMRTDIYDVVLSDSTVRVGTAEVRENPEALAAMEAFFRSIRPTLTRRMVGRLRRLLTA